MVHSVVVIVVAHRKHHSSGLAWGKLERLTGIEPAYQAWEASALPLSYSRVGTVQKIGQ